VVVSIVAAARAGVVASEKTIIARLRLIWIQQVLLLRRARLIYTSLLI
jgi:hypothetical protein